ncbi:PQQ-like beta-propeller repeat protein [Actinomadura rupiterrae]|uniref:PQQ-like beta-propeller repeat protein n=1 Tax=Actinomadura rupiterrae TaxID=559627 RepID=UPI0020A3FD90|nr:PQQ-like beta-propeller repeat protein [Actinomadura rupiterrae]MCP2337010.1 hypothetical protein [Actinomadura rupiterrae]
MTTVLAVLTVACAAGLSLFATGYGDDGPSLAAEHGTSGPSRSPALSGPGPGAGNLTADWSTTLIADRPWFAARQDVLLVGSSSGIDGYDPHTGTRRWYFHTSSPDAKDWSYRMSGPVLTIDRGYAHGTSGPDLRTALDPSSGRVLWNKLRSEQLRGNSALGNLESAPYTPSISAKGEVSGPDWHTIGRVPAGFGTNRFQARVSGDYVVIPGEDTSEKSPGKGTTDQHYLAVINTRTRKSRVLRTGIPRAFTVSGTHAYLVTGNVGSGTGLPMASPTIEAALLPAGLDVIDLTTAKSRRLPLPVLGGNAVASPTQSYPQWIAAGGGHLFLASMSQQGGSRVQLSSVSVSDAKEPLALGGVRPSDWPDPCRLAPHHSSAPNETDPGHLTIDGTTLPRVGCTYKVASGETVNVTVGWVAASDRAAHQLFSGLPAGQPQNVGDESATYPGSNGAGARTIARVGRTVVIFLVNHRPSPPDAASQSLMTEVAATLRTANP